jgi:hypothetical protein
MADAVSTAAGRSAHEPDLPSLRGIVIGAGAVVAVVLAAVAVAMLMAHDQKVSAPTRSSGAAAAPAIAVEPALQALPQLDIAAFRQDKRRLLDEYAWVDRARGVVRIPIERAMDLLVQQQREAGR